MANTTNYNWETPDDTDLVKDGAAAIRTLGSSIDTTTKALNPSTTLGDIEYRSSTANTNTRLAIGTTGQVLTVAGGVPSWATPAGGASFSGVSCKSNANQTIANNTYVAITWNQENFDTNTYHDNTTNNSRITIPSGKEGYYKVDAFIATDSAASGAKNIYLRKNGTEVCSTTLAATTAYETITLSFVLNLAVSDYIEIVMYQSSGGNATAYKAYDAAGFSAYLIGA